MAALGTPSALVVVGLSGRKEHEKGAGGPYSRPSRLGSVGRLGRMDVQRAGLVVAVSADLIGKALAGFRRVRLDVPLEGASFERQIVAAGFRLDRAAGLIDVERIDGAKILHGDFLLCQGSLD